ncbi:MAG: hypothetical protein LPH19_01410 [Shewanella sp.]|nr:hypothetical protein [Shewanella sp.]MCF1429650.1 hypothetical protein [Shewanella sp.]
MAGEAFKTGGSVAEGLNVGNFMATDERLPARTTICPKMSTTDRDVSVFP